MRRRLLTAGALAAVAAATGVTWVVAQESQLPPVAAPPEETAAAPEPAPAPAEAPRPYATDESGLPTAPVPYNVLVPKRARPQAERQTRSVAAAPAPEGAAGVPTEPGELPPQAPRPKHQVAILQAVDKVTAETLRFEAPVGKPVRYKTLVFTLRACETEAVDEPVRESAAHLTITSQPKGQPGRVQPEAAQVFRGWMFASSAGLNPFEHPIYDAWLVSCKLPPEAVTAPGPGPGQGVQPAPTPPPRPVERQARATASQPG